MHSEEREAEGVLVPGSLLAVSDFANNLNESFSAAYLTAKQPSLLVDGVKPSEEAN